MKSDTASHQSKFNLTPRAYCIEAGRSQASRGGYVAASRAFSSALTYAPQDEKLAAVFKRSVQEIRKSRPFFRAPQGKRKQFLRGTIAPKPKTPDPEPEPEPSSEEEDDGPQRRRKTQKEFRDLWMRLSRDIKEIMKKEDDAGWGQLKNFLQNQYNVLKEVFQHYCALDASLGATAGGGPKKAASADDMYTMSGLEWMEFAKDIGAVLDRKNVRKTASMKTDKSVSMAPKPVTPVVEPPKEEEKEEGEGDEDDAAAKAELGEKETEMGEREGTTETGAEEAAEIPADGEEQGAEQPKQTKKTKERPTVELPVEEEVEFMQLEEAALDLIFVRANWERDDSGKFIQDDTNPDYDMLMFEFVHGMLRLAMQVRPIPRDQHVPLVERFKTFWEKMVVPKASRANIEGFRELMQAKSVQKALAKNELRLNAIFSNYAAAEEDNERQACMSLGEFNVLCKDANMFCEHFTLKHAAAIYTHSQQDLDFDEVDPMDVELDFDEFKECLCRAANLINPEEFLRLSIKVEQLMELLDNLALQSGALEHEADYAKPVNEVEEEVKEEEGGEGLKGEVEEEGDKDDTREGNEGDEVEVGEADGPRNPDRRTSSVASSDYSDDDSLAAPDLVQASQRFIDGDA